MTSEKPLKATLSELDSYKLTSLDVDTRRSFLNWIADKTRKLQTEAIDFSSEVQSQLDAGDPTVLERVRIKSTRIREEMQRLEDLEQKITDSIERSVIRERMAKFFGSTKRLVVFETLIIALIIFVLALLVYDFTAGADESRPKWLSKDNIFWIDASCCLIFMFEFFLRMKCADDRGFVWRKHWVDFVTSIPIPGEAQLSRFGRFGRLGRFLRILRFLRFLRFFFLFWRGMDKLQDVMDIKMMKKTIKWSVILTIIGAIAVYHFEGVDISKHQAGDSAEQVSSYPLALWWSFTTVLTGGFGDIHNPATIGGQLLTGLLVVMGMVVVGVFTATLTSIFVGEQSEELEKLSTELSEQIAQLAEKVAAMIDEQG